jgi:hypothetical protein
MYPLKWKHASFAKKKSPTRETLLVKDFVVDNRPIANWQTTQLEQAE